MRLTVVIINYKVRDLLLQCLDSVYRNRVDFAMEVVVVDNHSLDGSREAVARHFPEARYVELPENAGFARACNVALRASRADYALLLNPDTLLPEDTLARAVAFAERAERFGALGVRMIDTQGRFLPESKRNRPTLWNAFVKMSGLGRLTGRNPYYRQEVDDRAAGEAPVLSGAFMLLNRKALGDTCLLDEDFFMYGEDIDLSVRILEAGYRNYYLPIEILHYKGESARQDKPAYIRNFYNAMDVYYRKHYRRGGWAVALAMRLLRGTHLALAGLPFHGGRPAGGGELTLDASRTRYSDLLREVEARGAGRRLRVLHPDLGMETVY